MKKVRSEMFEKNQIISVPITKKLKLPNVVNVECRPVGMRSKGVPHRCHGNVSKMVYRYGGSQVIGYSINAYKFGREDGSSSEIYRIFPHSVWLNPEGELVCLTMGHKYQKIRFIPFYIYDQNDIKEFFEKNTKIPLPMDLVCDKQGNWLMVESDEEAENAATLLIQNRKIRKIQWNFRTKYLKSIGCGHHFGNSKKNNLIKSIEKEISDVMNGTAVSAIFVNGNFILKDFENDEFLPDVKIPLVAYAA